MTVQPPTALADPERRFTSGAGIVLALCLFLVGLNVGQLVYRLTLPTDGWTMVISPDDISVLDLNVLGAATPLRAGDEILTIGGRPADQTMGEIWSLSNNLPSGWQAGHTILYEVRRASQTLSLEVPLYHWRAAPLLRLALDISFGSIILLVLVAGLAFALRPGNWGARALCVLTAVLLAMNLSGLISQPVDGLLPTRSIQMVFTLLAWSTLLYPTFFLLTLCFPRPTGFLARRPRLVLAIIYVSAPLLMLLTGRPVIGWALVVVWAVLSLATIGLKLWTVRDPVGRAQMRWAAAGMSLGAFGIIANNVATLAGSLGLLTLPTNVPRFLQDLPVVLAIVAPALGLAVAILRYRLFEIDVIIRRTLVYAVLTGLLGAAYLISVVILEALLRPFTRTDQNPYAIVVSTLAIAALFVPLRRRVQAFIDQRFYRRKYRADQTLAAYADSIRNETNLDALSGHLAQVIDEAMQPTTVTVWLRSAK